MLAYHFNNILYVCFFILQQYLQQGSITYLIGTMQTDNNFFINKYLPQAKPLHTKTPVVTQSIYKFDDQVINPDNDNSFKLLKQHEQPLNDSNFDKHIEINEAPTYLKTLFSNPLYVRHKYLNIEDSFNFASCKLQIKVNTCISPCFALQNEDEIAFSSNFQSGNLAIASRSNQQSDKRQYNLALQRDLNSNLQSSTQWFYFKVMNNKIVGNIKFNIVNYMKEYSSFNKGMKVCIYNTKIKKWVRAGQDIRYFKNNYIKKEAQDGKISFYYTLTFTYKFQSANEEVYFAYCYPYTYSRMIRYLTKIQNMNTKILHRRAACKSIGGNDIQMLTITNPGSETENNKKKIIFITARVHPGQTVGSFICEGLLDFLLSKQNEAQKLRNQYIFRVFPMLNPDGVINGHYRTSLSGKDLNRHWSNPDKILHPQIIAVKKIITETPYQRSLYIDLHGHSKKKSSFMYGCQNNSNPFACRQFPYLLSQKGYNFNYYYCNFNTQKSREGTSRISIWKQLDLAHSYTFEASFCGPHKNDIHFTRGDYYMMGKKLGQGIYLYFCKKQQINHEVKNIIRTLYESRALVKQGNQQSDGSCSDLDDNQVSDNFLQHRIISQGKSGSKLNLKTNYIPPSAKKRWFSFNNIKAVKISKLQHSQSILQQKIFHAQNLKINQLQLQPNSGFQTRYLSTTHPKKPKHHFGQGQLHSKFVLKSDYINLIQKPYQGFNEIVFPKVLRSEYKRYNRLKKQQSEIKVQVYKDKSSQQKFQARNSIELLNQFRRSSMTNYGNQQTKIYQLTNRKNIRRAQRISSVEIVNSKRIEK